MLLSKLDQRCEAAFVHIKMESGGMWRDGLGDRKELFVDWYLEKQRPLSPCMPLILIVSVHQYFDASFVSALVSLLCVWNTSSASACFISGPGWSINDTAAFAFAQCIIKLLFN